MLPLYTKTQSGDTIRLKDCLYLVFDANFISSCNMNARSARI